MCFWVEIQSFEQKWRKTSVRYEPVAAITCSAKVHTIVPRFELRRLSFGPLQCIFFPLFHPEQSSNFSALCRLLVTTWTATWASLDYSQPIRSHVMRNPWAWLKGCFHVSVLNVTNNSHKLYICVFIRATLHIIFPSKCSFDQYCFRRTVLEELRMFMIFERNWNQSKSVSRDSC